MAESCSESKSEEELFLSQSTFTVNSDEYDGKYLLSVVAIHLVLRSCVQPDAVIVVQEWVCRRAKEWKCLEDNAGISEGMYYLKLFIKVLEADMDANVLFLVREIVMYVSKYFQS